MSGEFDFYGLFVPDLLLYAVLALGVEGLLSRAVAALGWHRLLWHPALVQISLYVMSLAGIVIATRWIES